MTASALLSDGNVVTLVAAYETADGPRFADGLGNRYRPDQIVSWRPALEVVR